MNTYCLVYTGTKMPRWSELTNDRKGALVWVDLKGRSVPFEGSQILASVTGPNIHSTIRDVDEDVVRIEQEHAYRYLLDPWSTQGWLSPEGKFWGCRFFAHDDIATALLRTNAAGLENKGWIRVHDDSFQHGDVVRGMTRSQQRTLEKLGFTEFEAPGRRVPFFEVDRSLPPPRYAVKVPDGVLAEMAVVETPQTAPVAEPESHLPDVIAWLSRQEALSTLFSQDYEVVPDVGPGTWEWMIQWNDLFIGSEEHPEDLLSAAGMRLCKTSGDTIEIISWHEPGLSLKSDELNMIAYQSDRNITRYA